MNDWNEPTPTLTLRNTIDNLRSGVPWWPMTDLRKSRPSPSTLTSECTDPNSHNSSQRQTAWIACMEDNESSSPPRQHQQRPQPPPSNRQRGRRFRIACARCHHRKIRCDATTPSCGACVRSGVDCIYQGVLPGVRERRSRSRAS